MNIRIATYNIHKFIGRDRKRDEARILAIIRAIDADVMALQEFVLHDHSDNMAMVEAFAEKAGYHFVAQPMRRANGMVQFNLLLTRSPVTTRNIVTLPRDGKEPRGVINVALDIDGTAFHIAATHLGLMPSVRMRQLELILDLGAQRKDAPFALLGDLNTLFPWEAARRHLEQKFPSQKQPLGFPSRLPLLAFDSIYLRHKEMIQSLRLFTEGSARSASDHLPLVADIRLA